MAPFAAETIPADAQRMSRKSGNRFSEKDMRPINESRAHPDRSNRDALAGTAHWCLQAENATPSEMIRTRNPGKEGVRGTLNGAGSDMQTPNIEKENRHRAAHTTRPTRRKSSSVSGADVGWIPTAGKNCVLVATDFPTTPTTRSWRASTGPVESASGPAWSSASIMTMRPTRCAACFVRTATRRSDFSRTTRTSRTQARCTSGSRLAMRRVKFESLSEPGKRTPAVLPVRGF